MDEDGEEGKESGSRAGPNRKSSLHGRSTFLQSDGAGIPPGCRYRSARLERIHAVEKSDRRSFHGHFFRDGRGDKGRPSARRR